MFRVENLMELDRARYLLNFDRIELGLASSGDWTVYYRYPCRFLDRDDYGCTAHHTVEQPNVCDHYNPFSCWYKQALNEQVPDDFVRVDRARLDWLMDRVVFDEAREIVEVPAWEVMVDAFGEIPASPLGVFESAPPEAPAFSAWHAVTIDTARHRRGAAAAVVPADDPTDPCTGCAAPCCQTVVFPMVVPDDARRLDFVRFTLGFPGIEVGVSQTGEWTTAVTSACRHFSDGRCSVYGTPDRPLLCSYYDEHNCAYRREFLPARPHDRVRIRLEEFAAFAALYEFDQNNLAIAVPDADSIRAAIESSWVAAVTADRPRRSRSKPTP